MKSNCSRNEEMFGDYLDGRLGSTRQAELERHFVRCATCRELYAEYQEVVASLRSLKVPSPSAAIESKILSAVLPRVKARYEFLPVPSWRNIAAMAAAAVLAMSFLGLPRASSQGRLGKEVSQTSRRLYSFGVRAYRESERLVDELNVLRMTVGVAFEDRIDQLNERLRDLEEIQKSRQPAEQSHRGGHLEVVAAPTAKRSHL